MMRQIDQQLNANLEIKLDLDQVIIKILEETVGYTMSHGTIFIGSASGDFTADLRETLIFKKIDDEWKLMHMHWSFPFASSEEDVPYPKLEVLSENISNWLSSLEIDTSSVLMNNLDKKLN